MRICILVTIMNNGFGVQWFYQSQEIGLGKKLSDLGHDVTIVKTVPASEKASIQQISERLWMHTIPSKSYGVHGMFPLSALDKYLDVLFMFSDTQLIMPKVYQYCKRNHILFIPYAGVVHSVQTKGLKTVVSDTLFRSYVLPVYKQCHTLVKTAEVETELKQLGVPDISVAPVGMDLTRLKKDFLSYDRQAIRSEFGYSEDDIVICFIARFMFEKRPVDAVRILNRLRNIGNGSYKLLMIGTGELENDVRLAIQNAFLEPYVQIIDKVPYDDMWKIHYLSDYFLNLRHNEIFGMAVTEAVYYHSAVAAIHAPGPDYILDGMESHRLCSNDDEIVQWIAQNELSKNGFERDAELLQKRCSWDTCVEQILKLCEESGIV